MENKFQEQRIKLKILGFVEVELNTRNFKEIHFVSKSAESSHAVQSFVSSQRAMASYVYDLQHQSWIKCRLPIDTLPPLTKTERILYGHGK